MQARTLVHHLRTDSAVYERVHTAYKSVRGGGDCYVSEVSNCLPPFVRVGAVHLLCGAFISTPAVLFFGLLLEMTFYEVPFCFCLLLQIANGPEDGGGLLL